MLMTSKTMSKYGERVVCAASKIGDKVYLCIRHGDRFTRDAILSVNKETDYLDLNRVDGFVTNRGNFLDREQALQLALDNGQVTPDTKIGFSGELFSEDLY